MTAEKKSNLTLRILIGMFSGLILGLLTQKLIGKPDELTGLVLSIHQFFIGGLAYVGGKIFIASLKMLVVPLVFVSLVCGTCSLSDPKKLGSLGIKTISLYLVTTAIAISLAMSFALLISPGENANLITETTFSPKTPPPLTQVLIDIVPTNPIQAMAEANMLQVIVFAVLFGLAIALSGDTGQRVAQVFQDFNTVILKLVLMLMNFAPYGVFCLMLTLFSSIDGHVFANLIYYFITVLIALGLHATVTFSTLLTFFTPYSPKFFFSQMKETALFGFSTSSSNATIPITLKTATDKLGVHPSVASFVVPLGATINMDGTAIMQGVATVFIAQAFNIDLSLVDYLTVILTATLASIGTAGVPGAGLIMLAMVLGQVGLPVEGIALIIGVDRLLDMTRTAVNLMGDCTVTCVVAHSENALDHTKET